MNFNKDKQNRPHLPEWIRVKPFTGHGRTNISEILDKYALNTVCKSAKCPNLGECWHKKTATFMILGNTCTRNCRFCSVNYGTPGPLDPKESENVARAAKEMGLKYVVVTSVTRDDLPDGGASVFAETIIKIRELNYDNIKIEVLTPDFNCDLDALKTVLATNPSVFNHNIETVKRLSKEIRITASYENSLFILRKAFEIAEGKIPVKSGLMVGTGETDDEIIQCISDLRYAGVSMLTIGQYLPPKKESWPLDRYVTPAKFEEWKKYAESIGYSNVASAPLVRSSYCAEELNSSSTIHK
jgi:lipoic acid synthetase